MHALQRFLNNRKTTKSGYSRSHATLRFLLPTFVLLQVVRPLGGFSLQVSLCFGSTSIHSHALLNTKASTCFIDESFVRAHNIPTVRTSQPISVEAIDGRVLSSGAVTEATIPLLLHVGPLGGINVDLIANPRHLIVLGLSWLATHNPRVQPLHHVFTDTNMGHDSPQHYLCGVCFQLGCAFFRFQPSLPHC